MWKTWVELSFTKKFFKDINTLLHSSGVEMVLISMFVTPTKEWVIMSYFSSYNVIIPLVYYEWTKAILGHWLMVCPSQWSSKYEHEDESYISIVENWKCGYWGV
jgi:hypothetical protein